MDPHVTKVPQLDRYFHTSGIVTACHQLESLFLDVRSPPVTVTGTAATALLDGKSRATISPPAHSGLTQSEAPEPPQDGDLMGAVQTEKHLAN